jgi:Zn-dependent membrane protease YugP
VWQNWVYIKWGSIDNSRRITGAETAQLILSNNAQSGVVVRLGIDRVYIVRDDYDPRSKIVWLSLDNFKGESVTALAVSAQRSAQALQDASGYPMFRLRSWLLPLANFGATYGPITLPFGILTGIVPLLHISVLLFVGAILFHLVTLPVEFNANQRALRQMENLELVSEQELVGARRVLAAAAMAYVGAAATQFVNKINYDR